MKQLERIRDRVSERIESVKDYQMSLFRKEPELGYQKKNSEIVSEVDIRSELMLKEMLNDIMPEAAFYGEETSKEVSSEWTWVVDPIDGTVNYVSGLHEWCISVALLHERQPVVGCISKPATGETYRAVKGGGAEMNGRDLPIFPFRGELSDALIATGMPFRSRDVSHGFFVTAESLLPGCREIRRMGSAALDMTYTASGFFQGYWETDLQPYDIAAAALLCSETGIKITDFFGKPYDLFEDRSCIAAHPSIHEDLMRIVQRGYEAYSAALHRPLER